MGERPTRRRSIAIVGAGQAGLYLGIDLVKRGFDVTICTDRAGDELRTGPVLSSQCMFGDARALERFGVPLFGSDGHPDGWSMNLAEHQGSTRKRMWSKTIAAVQGEMPSPFVVAAIVSEAASLVTNWGSSGLESINADISLTLARTPATTEMGIEADCHITDAGITAASAVLYDRDGPLGISTVAALGNSANRIDLAQR